MPVVELLLVAAELHRRGMNARAACEQAELLTAQPGHDRDSFIHFSLDRDELARVVDARLREAAESVVMRRRGRPHKPSR